MYQSFLIKYAEIAIKGKNRHLFEDALVSQICHALREVDGEFNVRKEQGRIYVEAESEFDYEETVEALQHVFGIVGICPVIMAQDEGFDALAQMVVAHVKEVYGDKSLTFKVDARRARKNYPMTSMEINAELGGRILDACPNMSVDVHDPDVMVHVEIRNQINIYSSEIPGPGGMPVGTNGKAMLLLSGGIDSPVAGYMIAKRGVSIDATYFHAPPYTSERAKQKVVDLAKLVAKYSGPINLHIVNFTDIQLAIYEKFIDAGIPHYTGADSFALNGAFLGYGVNYEDLGTATADMVVDILVNGKNPAETPVQTLSNGIATVNTETAEALGIDYSVFSDMCEGVVETQTAEEFE